MQLPRSRACWKLPATCKRKPVTVGVRVPARAPAVFMMPANEPIREPARERLGKGSRNPPQRSKTAG